MKTQIYISTLCLSAFLAFSCRMPIEDVNTSLEPEFAVPLLETKTTVKEMLEGIDSTVSLTFGTDGQITAQFSTTALSKSTLDPFDGIPSNFVPLIDTAFSIPFAPPGGLKISTVDFKKGMTLFLVSNNFNESLTVTFRIPQMTKNGVAYQKVINLPKGVLGQKDSVDLTGYSFVNPNDAVKVHYDARKNSNNERVVLTNAQMAFKGMQGKYIKGYFGINRFDIPKDSMNIAFIDKLTRGEVRFSDPKITLLLENSYGIPVRARVNTAEVITADKKRIALSGTFVSNGTDLNYPAINEVGQMKTTQITMDKTNSNLVDIASARPLSFVFDIDGIINPDGNRNITGFMLDTSSFRMKMNIDVPLYGTVKGFEERDTLSFDMPSTDNLKYAEFKIIVDNGTGLNAQLQAYFLDASNRVVDSLFTVPNQTILKAATVDATGKVTAPANQITFVKIEETKFLRLKTAKKAIVKYTFSTVNNGSTPIRLFSNQEIKVRMGVVLGTKL